MTKEEIEARFARLDERIAALDEQLATLRGLLDRKDAAIRLAVEKLSAVVPAPDCECSHLEAGHADRAERPCLYSGCRCIAYRPASASATYQPSPAYRSTSPSASSSCSAC